MNDTEELSLREAKRRATRAAIEDRATALVAEQGIENVTVEDICAAVGISKRTFFNYVDSKETAIFGDPPRLPDEAEREEFLNRRHENVLAALLKLSSTVLVSEQLMLNPSRTEILRRRKEIRHRSPELILQRHASFHEIHHVLKEMVVDYYRRHPEAMVLGSDPEREAATLVTLASNALQLGYLNWMNGSDSSTDALNTACRGALHDITTLIEGQPK